MARGRRKAAPSVRGDLEKQDTDQQMESVPLARSREQKETQGSTAALQRRTMRSVRVVARRVVVQRTRNQSKSQEVSHGPRKKTFVPPFSECLPAQVSLR